MEQLVVLLIIGAIALVKWVIKQSSQSGSGEAAPPISRPTASAPRRETTSEEERMRRFMEALGLPAGSRPPKIERPALSRQEVLEQQRQARRLPPAPETIQRSAPPRIPKVFVPPPFEFPQPAPVRLPPVLEVPPVVVVRDEPVFVPETFEPPTDPAVPRSTRRSADLRDLLRGVSLRDAIVLREVLGPPRGFQKLL